MRMLEFLTKHVQRYILNVYIIKEHNAKNIPNSIFFILLATE